MKGSTRVDIKWRKKGFSLIECVTAIAIADIILAAAILMYRSFVLDFRKTVSDNLQNYYVEQPLLIIQGLLYVGDNAVVITDSKITIYEKVTESGIIKLKIKDVLLRNNKIYIDFIENGRTTPRVILKNVQNFNIEQDSDLLIINIKMDNGKVYTKCLDLKKIKRKVGSY